MAEPYYAGRVRALGLAALLALAAAAGCRDHGKSAPATTATSRCPTSDPTTGTRAIDQLFAEEPRDPDWAARLEPNLTAQVQGLERVECRCRCCRLVARCADQAACNRWRASLSKNFTPIEKLGFGHLFVDGKQDPSIKDSMSAEAFVCKGDG